MKSNVLTNTRIGMRNSKSGWVVAMSLIRPIPYGADWLYAAIASFMTPFRSPSLSINSVCDWARLTFTISKVED